MQHGSKPRQRSAPPRSVTRTNREVKSAQPTYESNGTRFYQFQRIMPRIPPLQQLPLRFRPPRETVAWISAAVRCRESVRTPRDFLPFFHAKVIRRSKITVLMHSKTFFARLSTETAGQHLSPRSSSHERKTIAIDGCLESFFTSSEEKRKRTIDAQRTASSPHSNCHLRLPIADFLLSADCPFDLPKYDFGEEEGSKPLEPGNAGSCLLPAVRQRSSSLR